MNKPIVYLDHAATTPLHSEVVRQMMEVLSSDFGNPSSTHQLGRKAKQLMETARKKMAAILGVQTSELIVTSGATEAINWILKNAVSHLSIRTIVSSKMEHHATLHTLEYLSQNQGVQILWVRNNESGEIDLNHLAELLQNRPAAMVAIMHVNNETGVVNPIEQIGTLCQQHQALFMSDCVQSAGKMNLNLGQLPLDFAVLSAHKFNGPKGIGLAYIKKGISMTPQLHGGEQEKGWRGGTEAVHQVVGMAAALDLAHQHLADNQAHLTALQKYAISQLNTHFEGIHWNGADPFCTILNISFPWPADMAPLLVFRLDLSGIAVSRGSACQSGSSKPSHVLAEMGPSNWLMAPSIRISFGVNTQKTDIDALVEALLHLKPNG
ncbi:MAG: cysteine desulfurase [Flavobacterium sp. BFFFF2]|nr:MAG: cysteine desulfurase [Flavobacterium sp. BFFFF2]